VLKASEDKTFPGAIVASLASPWGQSVQAGVNSGGKPSYFGSYREVFARDLYEAFTGLLADGDIGTARAATRFLFDRQQLPDGSMPRNSLLNGKAAPDTGGTQLDEAAYPILMADLAGLGGDSALWKGHIEPAADFLVANGPSDGVERWEEQSGYSPSTIAAEIAGLTAASAIAASHGDAARARLYQATADDFQRNIKAWTVTTTGPDAPRYFIRLSKTGDPNAGHQLQPRQRRAHPGPAQPSSTAASRSWSGWASSRSPTPTSKASLAVLDKQIAVSTPSGTGYYRYGNDAAQGSADGYGDCYQPARPRARPPAPPGRRPVRGPGTCGPTCPASAPSPTSPPVTAAARSPCSRRSSASPPAWASCPSRTGRTRTCRPRPTAATRPPPRSGSPRVRRPARPRR
jgi:glucoamylase